MKWLLIKNLKLKVREKNCCLNVNNACFYTYYFESQYSYYAELL